jgi:hypothetical protein
MRVGIDISAKRDSGISSLTDISGLTGCFLFDRLFLV